MNNDEKKIKNVRKKKVVIILLIIMLAILIGVLILQFLIKNNEDIEAKVIGSMNGVDWSQPIEVSTESLEKFDKELDKNLKRYEKNIIVVHNYDGCSACLEEIIDEINKKKYNTENLNIMLVTNMHEDDINLIYGDKINGLSVFSDFDYQIGRKLKVFNEIDMRNEDVVICINGESIDNSEEYYFEESNEVFEYIDSKIGN